MRTKLIGVGAAALLLLLLPFVLTDFGTGQFATVGALFIAILGLDVLTGHSGQISLGNGAFMAVGGYTTAILVANHGVQDVWTIAAAAGVAGAVGLLAGIPALRLRGFYLALATFGLALVLPTILEKFDHFTGGLDRHLSLRHQAPDGPRGRCDDPRRAPVEQPVAVRPHVDDRRTALSARLVAARSRFGHSLARGA